MAKEKLLKRTGDIDRCGVGGDDSQKFFFRRSLKFKKYNR